jgi:arsenate reductase-like glutaredoxin family protein
VKKLSKKVKKNKKRGVRSLVVSRLENVSKDVFRKYYSSITDLIGNSYGIYALYDGSDLYYVGKSTDLRKRVRHHLRDRHLASWTHFSLYLVRKAEHIPEFESLLVRIANPKGNRNVPKGKSSSIMLKKLQAMVKQKQKEEFERMFGSNKLRNQKLKKFTVKHQKTLDGLVSKRTPLYRTYKGKEYKAILTSKGIIRIGNKNFNSPTAAAKAIVDRSTVNGWTWWYIKDSSGEWVRLSEYKG